MISKKHPEQYADRVMLAPMVRENSLPFRLLCLKYGANLVFTEELIDYKLSGCRRLQNKVLGTIDFVDERGEVVLRTCPEEREQLILQIGSNNPSRALKAAQLVAKDIVGLDFNFGCPKAFSLSGGMGAALLEKPEEIEALLKESVENLNIPVTCKIRLLPNLEDSIKLVEVIEACGVSAIAIHGRTKDQRPRHENQDNWIRAIVESASIPVIANGGSNHIKSYADILKFKEATKASSVMIARVAMKNPSVFRSDNILEPINDVIQEFIKLAVRYDNFVSNSKYSIQFMMAAGHYGTEFVHKFHSASDYRSLCDLFELSDWYQANRLTRAKSEYYDPLELEDEQLNQVVEKKLKTFAASCGRDSIELISDNVPFAPRVYGSTTPKAQLTHYINKLNSRHQQAVKRAASAGSSESGSDRSGYKERDKNRDRDKEPPPERPAIDIFQLEQQRRYYCLVKFGGVCYLNKTFSSSKKGAEQATMMLLCERLGLADLADYKSRTNASTRNVT